MKARVPGRRVAGESGRVQPTPECFECISREIEGDLLRHVGSSFEEPSTKPAAARSSAFTFSHRRHEVHELSERLDVEERLRASLTRGAASSVGPSTRDAHGDSVCNADDEASRPALQHLGRPRFLRGSKLKPPKAVSAPRRCTWLGVNGRPEPARIPSGRGMLSSRARSWAVPAGPRQKLRVRKVCRRPRRAARRVAGPRGQRLCRRRGGRARA